MRFNYSTFLLLFSIFVVMSGQYVYGQNKIIKREICPDCGKLKQLCEFKGKHPKKPVPTTGTLFIDSSPSGAAVKIGNEYVGNTPVTLNKKAGNYLITINAEGYETYKETVSIKAGKKTEKLPELKKKIKSVSNQQAPEPTGYDVTFSSNVPSAKLYIDDELYGTANSKRFIKTGKHAIRLTAQGHKDYTQDITINAKSDKSFFFSMTKEEPIQPETPKRNLPEVIRKLESEMVLVAGGTFTMGATKEQESSAKSHEKPAHEVTVSDFYICKHEVTQEEWEKIMGTDSSRFKGDKLPVEQVSWENCQVFIQKLNELTGKTYRLPTEAEWEYAARGGQKGQNNMYCGSNAIIGVAWHNENSGNKSHDVMTKSPNELGLYDMSGNVAEWCSDWYRQEYYKANYSPMPLKNPKGPDAGEFRVIRGGSWLKPAKDCRVSARDGSSPNRRNSCIGFRLAR